MKLLVWSAAVLSLSVTCFAVEDVTHQPSSNSMLEPQTNTWVELGLGTVTTINVKHTTDNKGWGISIARYDDFEILGDGNRDQNGHWIDDGVDELGVLRVQSNTWRWGYSDISYGLAYQHAILANSCKKVSSGLFGATYDCIKEDKKGLSIPLEVNLACGRYAGLGLKFRGSIGTETAAGIALTIPLGGFAKK